MQAEAVDTPFSPSKKAAKARQGLMPAETDASEGNDFARPAPSGEGMTALEQEKDEALVQSTGSGGLDALIDDEASKGEPKNSHPRDGEGQLFSDQDAIHFDQCYSGLGLLDFCLQRHSPR